MQVLPPSTETHSTRLVPSTGNRRDLVELIPQLVLVIDENGQLVDSNKRFRDATGLEHGAVAPWSYLFSENESWEFHSTWLAAAQADEPFEFESQVVKESPINGLTFLMQFRPFGTRGVDRRWYGTFTEVQPKEAILRDIAGASQQWGSRLSVRSTVGQRSAHLSKGSVEKYRLRSELLTDILNTLLESVMLFDATGSVQLANQNAKKLLGTELLSLPIDAWPNTGTVKRADQTEAGLIDLPAAQALIGEATPERELWICLTDQPRKRCECHAVPLFDSVGQIRGAVMVIRDVTDRRQMEAQLSQLQKMEAIGHLAAGIAHEINTPMQYVGDNLRFLRESCSDLLAERPEDDFLTQEIPPAIAQSIEGVQHVAAIVRAMKEFAGGGPEEAMAVSLNQIAENVLAVTRNVWKFGIEVILDLDSTLPMIPGFPRELNQAVYHLFINAIEAIRATSGGTGTIQLSTKFLQDKVQLSVADSGEGIPNSIRPLIFDPFYTTKAPGRHSGQGLTHVLATVVQRHRGSVDVLESPLGGACFVIQLPREW